MKFNYVSRLMLTLNYASGTIRYIDWPNTILQLTINIDLRSTLVSILIYQYQSPVESFKTYIYICKQ